MCVQRTLAFVSNRKELPEVYRNPVYAHVDDLRRRAQLGQENGIGHAPSNAPHTARPAFAYSPSLHSFHAQGSSGADATMPFIWRSHAKSPTTRAGRARDIALWLE